SLPPYPLWSSPCCADCRKPRSRWHLPSPPHLVFCSSRRSWCSAKAARPTKSMCHWPCEKRNGAARPRSKTGLGTPSGQVHGARHAEEHGDGEHGIDARGHAGHARGGLLLVRTGLDDAENLLLVRPDDEPHVE